MAGPDARCELALHRLDDRRRYLSGRGIPRSARADYFDLDASYAFSAGPLQGLELRVGVEKLTDEDPPIFPSWIQAGTDPSQHDVLGRRYYVSLRYAF